MIDQATGMKPGERYCVENIERAHQFPGFFQDGKYYLGPELLTAVGWLEGTRFIYDSLDAEGEPVYSDRVAGTVEGLKLVLVDGTALELSMIEASATLAPAPEDFTPPQAAEPAPAGRRCINTRPVARQGRGHHWRFKWHRQGRCACLCLQRRSAGACCAR